MKREAELFLATVEVAIARGEFVDATSARATIGELGAEWLQHQSHLKPSSRRSIEVVWRVHVEPRWGRVPVGAVRFSDVQAWVTERTDVRGTTTVLLAHGTRRASST